MPNPYEGPEHHIRNVLQAFAQPTQLAPVRWDFTASEANAIVCRLKMALEQVEAMEKAYWDLDRSIRESEDHADYVGSALPYPVPTMPRRAVQPVDYPLQQTDLTAEERSNRVAGQPLSEDV